jgi:CheY-like chemotaxis protein
MKTAPRVLIVEDEALIAILIERQLKDLGCASVLKTASAEDALVKAGRGGIDLVLMDIHLSGPMDGIEAARIIGSWQEHPRIAIMTAFGDQASRDQSMSLMPLAFMEKPLSPEDIAALLRAWAAE